MKTGIVLVWVTWVTLAIVALSSCASKPTWTGSGARGHHAFEPVTSRHWYIGTIQDRNLLRAMIYARDTGDGLLWRNPR